MPRFQDIPQFIWGGNYVVDVNWDYLQEWIDSQAAYCPVEIDPDFQRGHVWSMKKRIEYIEYILRGGQSSADIWWNCAGWSNRENAKAPLQLVDGKQRLTSVIMFLNDEIEIFGGNKKSDYTDKLRMTGPRFRVHVNNLQTKKEVLQWYLELNSGGVVHTEDELNRVRDMLEDENMKLTYNKRHGR